MWEKLKLLLLDDALFYALLIALVAVASFGLGRYSVVGQTAAGASGVTLTAAPAAAVTPEAPETPSQTVIASKSGTKYHLPTCPGAVQIKPENIIEFASPLEAEAAGYSPAANCPGLQ